ncbi:hypothetical protein [Streptomyces sp. WZ.A104]|uniref:hypothetical protein n=1 Tax=Streptomyces sp. WZ.A104 TaxID=2023771 RepID=UPI00211C0B40|nr:hypothetical protein [Streptomyces sp. WZ.A104]
MSRRNALITAAGVAAVGITSSTLLATPAAAAPRPLRNDELKAALRRVEARRRRILTDRASTNGWEMEKTTDDEGDIATRHVEGTPLSVPVRTGDVESVLAHVIRRFHYEVEALGLRDEPNPLVGWAAPSSIRDSRLPESNRASGTAVVVRPDSYPPGVRGGFTSRQELTIRDILADAEGVVRWGGDDRHPYEGLFYLNVPPGDARLARVAARIRAWREVPGAGAGLVPDVTAPSRRRRASQFR